MERPPSPTIGWELTNTTDDHRKFYRTMVQGTTILVNYGPIGATGGCTIHSYSSESEAITQALKLTREKARRGYLLKTKATFFRVDPGAIASLKRAKDSAALSGLIERMDEARDSLRTGLDVPERPDLAALRKALEAGVSAKAAAPTARRTGPVKHAEPTLDRVGPTERPNGQVYYPRSLGGQEDLAVLRAAGAHGDGTLLYGPPGTGKTALVEAAFPRAVQYVGHADTEVSDLVGTWIPNGSGDYAWEPGPLQRSLELDVPFFVDEIALVNPGTLSVLYPLLDGRGELQITTQSGRQALQRGPGWILVGAFNPDVPGAHVSEALLDRFALHIEVTTDFSLARELDVPGDIITVAQNLERKRIAGEVGWSPQLRTLLQFRDNLMRYGTQVAVANLIAVAPSEDRDEVIDVVQSKYTTGKGPLRLGQRTL